MCRAFETQHKMRQTKWSQRTQTHIHRHPQSNYYGTTLKSTVHHWRVLKYCHNTAKGASTIPVKAMQKSVHLYFHQNAMCVFQFGMSVFNWASVCVCVPLLLWFLKFQYKHCGMIMRSASQAVSERLSRQMNSRKWEPLLIDTICQNIAFVPCIILAFTGIYVFPLYFTSYCSVLKIRYYYFTIYWLDLAWLRLVSIQLQNH